MLILDAEGKRVAAKYYGDDYPTTKEQLVFEKNLFTKTHRANCMYYVSYSLLLSLVS